MPTKVVKVEPLSTTKHASLPGKYHADEFHTGRLTLAFPLENFGADLAELYTTVAGNLFELNEVSAIRLEQLELPSAFYEMYSGPKFGIRGTRDVADIHDRPLIGTIIKPSVGLSAAQTADLAYELALAGLDFIKDDELLANPAYAPFEERVRQVTQALERAAEKTGRKCIYAFNLTGNLDAMLCRHDLVVKYGGTCVMVNVHSVGLVATHHLVQHASVPVHGHRAGWGMLTRHPSLGMTSSAMQTLCHLAGVDHYHTSGLRNKFWEPDESVVASIKDCLRPPNGTQAMMPVLSSGQHAATVPVTYQHVQSRDLIHLAGGGILAHPDGVRAGVESMRSAWDAVLKGIPLEQARMDNPALEHALIHFGRQS